MGRFKYFQNYTVLTTKLCLLISLSSLIPNLYLHSQARLSLIHAQSLTFTAVSHSQSHCYLNFTISPQSRSLSLSPPSHNHVPLRGSSRTTPLVPLPSFVPSPTVTSTFPLSLSSKPSFFF